MGKRGPLAKAADEPQNTVTDLSPPPDLTGKAREFWERNCGVLASDLDRDLFAQLARMWDALQGLDRSTKLWWDGNAKVVQLAKQFGLTPESRRRSGPATEDRHTTEIFQFDA